MTNSIHNLCTPGCIHITRMCSEPNSDSTVGDLAQGGDSSLTMPGCVCWVSENVHILKDASGKINIPILKGFSAYLIGLPILLCNIKLKCIILKGHSKSIIF